MTSPAIDADIKAFLLNENRLHSFLSTLSANNRNRIKLSDIWVAFRITYSDLPDGPQRRVWLLTVLEDLAGIGKIKLPVRHGKLWDRTSQIALPALIDLPAAVEKGETSNWKNFPWHPRLQWVLKNRYISPADFEFLQRVNQGLVEGWFEEKEAFKYRSLQLTGDEKRLERLCKGTLFGPERLSLEVLGCEKEILPMVVATISAEPTMLLFENAAPFMLARRVLSEIGPSRIGCIGYGGGTQLIKSIGYFSMIDPCVRQIFYIGDLDGEGLQIGADLRRKSNDVPVRPATIFHVAMFESAASLNSPEGWRIKDDHLRQVPDSVFEFLDFRIRDRARQMVRDGRRIPEEVISHSLMRRLIEDLKDNSDADLHRDEKSNASVQ